MNQFCTFYIVRHAESEGNISKIHGGNQPLSSEGVLQAQKRGKDLKSIHFDYVFSSDLLRAQQTAELINLEHQLTVKATEMLRERNYGLLEETNRKEWKPEIKEIFTMWYNKEYKNRLRERAVAGMESDEELISRTITFLREIALAYPGKTVLVVTHGDLMQTLLVHLGYGQHAQYAYNGIQNTGYSIVRSDGVDFFVEGVKDIQLNHE